MLLNYHVLLATSNNRLVSNLLHKSIIKVNTEKKYPYDCFVMVIAGFLMSETPTTYYSICFPTR